jgi:hypothetical protein
MVKKYRPWGSLGWVLSRIPKTKWSIFGSLATEDRSLSTWHILKQDNALYRTTLLEIEDPVSQETVRINSKLYQLRKLKIAERKKQFIDAGGLLSEIEQLDLFGRFDVIVNNVNDFIRQSNGDILFDISALPKRLFFPALKLMMQSSLVKNLLVTYTIPKEYSTSFLSADHEPWRHLPLFAPPYPEPSLEVFVIGLGLETLGLPELLEHDYRDVKVKLLFPFPPGPPLYQRTWEFVRSLENNLPSQSREPVRVNARDTSEVFDQICAASENGKQYAILAPYGPKPMSLAVCIYATLASSPVYYTQPRIYNPQYSVGVSIVNGKPETYCYCVRLDGTNFYDLS